MAARKVPDVAATLTPQVTDVQRLFELHYLALVRLAMRLVDDQGSAEDVVQDVFARLARHPEQRLGEPANYLRRAVVNTCRSALRRRRVARLFLARAAREEPTEPADAAVLRGEDHGRMLRAIARLPHRQREVVVLRFYEDMSVTAIAEILAVSPNAVSAALARALAALARLLEDRHEV